MRSLYSRGEYPVSLLNSFENCDRLGMPTVSAISLMLRRDTSNSVWARSIRFAWMYWMGLFYEVLPIVFLYILISLATGLFVRHRGRQGSPVPEAVFPGVGQDPAQKGVLDGVRERVSGPFRMKKIVTNEMVGLERKSYQGM